MIGFTYLSDVDAAEHDPLQNIVNGSNEIKPRYTYLSAIYVSADAKNGEIVGNGLAVMMTDYPMTLTMAFERSLDGVNWTLVTARSIKTTGNGSEVIEAKTSY